MKITTIILILIFLSFNSCDDISFKQSEKLMEILNNECNHINYMNSIHYNLIQEKSKISGSHSERYLSLSTKVYQNIQNILIIDNEIINLKQRKKILEASEDLSSILSNKVIGIVDLSETFNNQILPEIQKIINGNKLNKYERLILIYEVNILLKKYFNHTNNDFINCHYHRLV